MRWALLRSIWLISSLSDRCIAKSYVTACSTIDGECATNHKISLLQVSSRGLASTQTKNLTVKHLTVLQAESKRHSGRSLAETTRYYERLAESKARYSKRLSNLKISRYSGRSLADSKRQSAPSMFVAVFIERAASADQRSALRDLWQLVDAAFGDNSTNLCMKFAVCKGDDNSSGVLTSESNRYGDILFLDCKEGYTEGKLTKKVLKTLEAYSGEARFDKCLDKEMIMKTDADTFVSPIRFRESIAMAVEEHGSSALYAGLLRGSSIVKRSGVWAEPCENWADPMFPPSMEGGPGYVLGKSLVESILNNSKAGLHMLWNEDKFVGAWINRLQDSGVKVDWVELPASGGYWWDWPVRSGTWGEYPYALHHRLTVEQISCLTERARKNIPDVLVDDCFELEPLPDKDWQITQFEQSDPPCDAT